ncbi:MAG: PucR family transcriptional regulator [Bifidobacteriaceae bacterium]|jgi:purine catabolism regulator|nr:PucR family transcriptional regulator [Bifidobacteriaceae bacterium]
MAISLQELVKTTSLKLSVEVTGSPGAFDEPISWVHSTELVDPTAYLDGGELILTTGLQLSAFESPTDRERHYVERLSRVGVRGIGFGTGLHHMSIPHWLVEQCEAWEMPLLGVPLDTPFIAIAKLISRSQSDSHNATVTRLYNAQRQLFRSIQTLDPLSSIVKKLAELVGGWAAFINPSGKVMESSHAALPLELRGVDDAMGFTALGQAKFLYSRGYDIAIFHVATAQRQSLGYLVAGRFGKKGSLNHPLVSQTAALLSLAVSRNASAERSLERLRAAMMRQCLEGDVSSVREYASDLWDGLPPEPLTVLRITGEQDALESAQEVFEPMHRSLAKNLNVAVSGVVEGDLWAIVSRSNLADWVDQVSHDTRLVTGISSGFVWADAPRARHEAYQAAAEAIASGEAVVRYGQRAGSATLEALIEPSMLRAFGDLRLAPIRDMTFNVSIGPHGGENSDATARLLPAIAVLRAWLTVGCKYEEAGRELGLHRHTVRKYISQICDRLSVDPSNPEHIAELWYACRGSQFDR